MEIGQPAPGAAKFKKSTQIQIAPEAPGDFPVLMHDVPKYGQLFVITKQGFFYMYDISTCPLLYRQRLTDQLVFVATRNPTTDGMIVVNKVGQVFSINVEDGSLVKYVSSA